MFHPFFLRSSSLPGVPSARPQGRRWGWRPGRRILALILLGIVLGSCLAQALPARAAPAAPSITFSVTTTADEAGAVGSGCSLREAITAANTNAAFGGCPAGSLGADTINLPAGTYTLSIANAGANEDNNASGDLDINQSLSIYGAGSVSTIIQAGTASHNGIDKVIAANPTCASGVSVTISGVTVRYGRNTQPANSPDFSHTGAGIDWCAGGGGETFTLSNAIIRDNTNLHGFGGGLNLDSMPGSTTVNISNVTFQNNIIDDDATTSNGTGAGINIFTYQSTVSITNCTFNGNQALRTNAGGGAIAYRPNTSSSLTISGSTFSNNLARGSGGAVYVLGLAAGTTISLQNDQFSGNTATTSFGGGIYLGGFQINSTPYALTSLSLTDNHAGTSGGGVYVGLGNVNLAYSRLVNNSAANGSGLYKSIDVGTVSAANNWWGCSTGPAAAPCDAAANIGGTLNYTPWLRSQLTSASAPLVTNQSVLLTASFLTDSAVGAVSAANLARLVGQPVSWSSTMNSLGSSQADIQAGGTATATFVAGGAGTATIAAKVDNDPTAGVSPNVLALVVNKASTTALITAHTPNPVVKGQSVAVSVTVTGIAGNSPTAPTGTITVSASPGGETCTITLPAASCNLIPLQPGAITLSATYNGDANFQASPASAAVNHAVKMSVFLPVLKR